LGHDWTVLKTSHTTSNTNATGGRPSNDTIGEDISEITEAGVANDSNNPENRV
jgi:hypothetical protein